MARGTTLNGRHGKATNGKNSSEEKPKSEKTKPFMHGITPDMINDPHPLEFANGMNSYDFACEKFRRAIIEPGGFSTLKSLQDFVKNSWDWSENASVREIENFIDKSLVEVENKIATEAKDQEALLKSLDDRVQQLKNRLTNK